MTDHQKGKPIEAELSRDLGFYSALAIGVGTMIAAGIFTLSGLAIRNVGSAAIVAFLLAAIVSIFTALAYCEFVSIYPRSGEGYLYARKTFTPPLAYMVGWSLFLGYTASCAFYIASLSSYFIEFIYHTSYGGLIGIVTLIGLTFLNVKGTKESGGFQIVVTAAKVILLVWFVIGGLSYVDTDEIIAKFSSDPVAIVSTSALVFITFFGFSAIAASAGEVKNAQRNIPRAIFWSVGIVTVLYTLVVLVTIAANLTEYTEAAMGIAAKQFLGGFGGMVIIAGAIFSMISASNASIMAGSRVALAMSKLGHLPKEVGLINQRTRTPIMALFTVGGTIAIFTLSLPLEDLAHFADTVLLIALIMVNFALIKHRRKYPDLKRPFRVPLVPLVPIIAIIANGYLLVQIFHHTLPALLAVGSLIVGMLGFLSWKGAQPEEESVPGEASRVLMETFAPPKNDKREYILVPLANPNTMRDLLGIAIALSKKKDSVIVLLRVVVVPEQMPLSTSSLEVQQDRLLLEEAQQIVEKAGVPVNTMLKIGYNAGRAILETARERHCQLIILGWKGYSSSRDKILGQVVDTVVTYARSDLMLVKLVEPISFKKILLPTAGGAHARAAEQYAASLAENFGGDITICRVESDSSNVSQAQTELTQAIERIESVNGIVPGTRIIEDKSITKGIIKASKEYDTLIIGATRTSIYQQIMFGSIPEQVARQVDKNLIVVKHHNPVRALIGRVMGD